MKHHDTIPSQLGPVSTMPSVLGPDASHDAGKVRHRSSRQGVNKVWLLALAVIVLAVVIRLLV